MPSLAELAFGLSKKEGNQALMNLLEENGEPKQEPEPKPKAITSPVVEESEPEESYNIVGNQLERYSVGVCDGDSVLFTFKFKEGSPHVPKGLRVHHRTTGGDPAFDRKVEGLQNVSLQTVLDQLDLGEWVIASATVQRRVMPHGPNRENVYIRFSRTERAEDLSDETREGIEALFTNVRWARVGLVEISNPGQLGAPITAQFNLIGVQNIGKKKKKPADWNVLLSDTEVSISEVV